MSFPNAEPSEATPPSTEPAPAPETTPHERALAALTRAKPAPDPGAPSVDTEPAPAESEGNPTPKPEETPSDDPRMARLYGQMARDEQKLRETQRQNRELQKRLEALESREREWDEDPFAAAERRGLDPRQWAAKQLGVSLGEDEPDPGEQALTRLQELEKREQERLQQEQQYKEQTRFAELRGHVGKFLEDQGLGSVKASPAAVERLTAQVRQMEQRGDFQDMEPERVTATLSHMAKEIDGVLRTEVSRYLQVPGALKALMQDETIRKMVAEATGQPAAGEHATAGGAGNEPRTITDRLASEPGTRAVPSDNEAITPLERERAATRALERAFASRKKAG